MEKKDNKDWKSQLVNLMVVDNYQLSQLGGWLAKVWPLALSHPVSLPLPRLLYTLIWSHSFGTYGWTLHEPSMEPGVFLTWGRSDPIQVGIPLLALWHFQGQSGPWKGSLLPLSLPHSISIFSLSSSRVKCAKKIACDRLGALICWTCNERTLRAQDKRAALDEMLYRLSTM